ncbi:PaaI family thioesterase [Histidinibacterium aquaticum]|uniref:PaaI family thioesterase n=1 Tax=Histidinibacterium aquaticum TaxID=2613962 RepID=A0A5J5GN38_9RHOB|nr:PaaI family thioesterase [Histidinibacterium aquaticum]KAA9009133.1 PaaI family thioesterase [Histidinibacterium aquaticum]
MDLKMDRAALETFLAREFPQAAAEMTVLSVRAGAAELRLEVSDRHLRPGGTVSGPSIFGLADVAMYVAVLSALGPEALAVTTNCSIDFMRKPKAGQALVAEARLLKLGRVLAVGDVLIRSGEGSDPVARASLTYSIPPKR